MGRVVNMPRAFARDRYATEVSGNTVRYLGRQFEGGELVHYRGYRTNLEPVAKRVKAFTDARPSNWKSEYEYIGSVDRVVIHDWLMRQGKNWHEFATDRDLKAKFMVFYRTEYPKMMAKAHQERRLTVNRTKHPVRKASSPSLGKSILDNYRKEMSA